MRRLPLVVAVALSACHHGASTNPGVDASSDATLRPDLGAADASSDASAGDDASGDATFDALTPDGATQGPDAGPGDAGSTDSSRDAAQDASSPSSATGCFPPDAIWPLAGASLSAIQDSYAYRTDTDIHTGVDLPTAVGTSARAVLPGTVVEIRQQLDCGHDQVRVTVEHQGDGCTFFTVYNHLDSSPLTLGAPLDQGDVVGSTNYHCDPAFPHLHFELRLACRLSACAVHPLRLLPYGYDPSVQPTVRLLSYDIPGGSFVAQVEVPRTQPDFVRVVCDHTRGNVVTSSYYDLEEAHAGMLFPNVVVSVDPYGTGDAWHVVRYTFSGQSLASGDAIRCYARDIQGTESAPALVVVP